MPDASGAKALSLLALGGTAEQAVEKLWWRRSFERAWLPAMPFQDLYADLRVFPQPLKPCPSQSD